jgi:hypothetical protein
MLPARPGKRAAVTGLDFNATAELLAAGGAGPHIQLHNYSSVLAAGTKCASSISVEALFNCCGCRRLCVISDPDIPRHTIKFVSCWLHCRHACTASYQSLPNRLYIAAIQIWCLNVVATVQGAHSSSRATCVAEDLVTCILACQHLPAALLWGCFRSHPHVGCHSQ